jgi:tRNA-splicing ligase RtcB
MGPVKSDTTREETTMTNSAVTFIPTGEATALLPARHDSISPITVIGTEKIRRTFDAVCIEQALNSREAPGVERLVLNPDAHCGYGAPIGSVLVSPTHIYPGPVGVDIKCSMSLLQLDVEAAAIEEAGTRRALIAAILERVPTGAGRGQRSAKKSRRVNAELGRRIAVEGASRAVCESLGIPAEWAERCEDSHHLGHDGTADTLAVRLEGLTKAGVLVNFGEKMTQLGSYGGGNHFGEAEVVQVRPGQEAIAETFGLRNGRVAFLSHCGSRGFGYQLASNQFKKLQSLFRQWSTPFPGNDKELVYAPLGTPEADAYIDDMSMGANFATVNHLLINALVLEAFEEVLPGARGGLVYFISHNIARWEPTKFYSNAENVRVADAKSYAWVHRKGATRAFPAGHPQLAGTPFATTGHPILLPGNPQAGSSIMVASPGAEKSAYSVNHGAGRMKGRKAAIREFDQAAIDASFTECDILTNCRTYPKDEAPAAYKDFAEVLKSVESADLAHEVARLKARFVIKDSDKADD